MPKKMLNINNFSAGLNNRTNPRDLKPNEFPILDTVDTETPGTIKIMGASYNTSKSNASKTYNNSQTMNEGNGLFHYNSDRDLDNGNLENSESLFVHSPYDKNVSIYDYTDDAWVASTPGTFSYGTTSALVEYHNVDGEVRVCPYPSTGAFSVNNTPKWYGYVNSVWSLGADEYLPITNSFTGFKSDDMYISPIKSNTSATETSTDAWGYDYEAALDNSTFSAKWGSEISLNEGLPGYYGSASGEIDSGNGIYIPPTNNTNPGKIPAALNTLVSYMNNYQGETSNESADYIAGFGTMRMYAWFNMRTTDADDSDTDILVYKQVGGAYDKKYALFASNVYGKQESVPVHIGYIAQPALSGSVDRKRNLYYSFIGRLPNKPRQTGMRIYWAKSNQQYSDTDVTFDDKYLLFEIDFKKGLRIAGKDNYKAFAFTVQYDASNAIVGHGSLDAAQENAHKQFCYPASYKDNSDCTTINGKTDIQSMPLDEPYIYSQPTSIGRPGTGYKTSTILNRRCYIGNISYYDDDNKRLVKNDTVLKSAVNEFDTFEIDRRLDVEINDGDDIIKLASVGDKLLEFKRKTLYIINTSRDIEFLEASLLFKGVEKDYHVVEGDGFVAWFNKYGVYVYDGNNFNDILVDQETGQKKLDDWVNNYYNDKAMIGYIPNRQTLIISNASGLGNDTGVHKQKVLTIDLKSLGWNFGKYRLTTEQRTNFQNLNDGTLIWYDRAQSGGSVTYDLSYWREAPSKLQSSTNIVSDPFIKTPSYVFNAPNMDKVITTVYISYKNGNNVTVKGFTDTNDGGSAVEHTIGTLSGTSDTTYRTLKIKLRNVSTTVYNAFKKVKSFGLIFSGDNMEDDFELNDIQIVYREKSMS
jgi:hypothetical protein